jgi:hypothetical protein
MLHRIDLAREPLQRRSELLRLGQRDRGLLDRAIAQALARIRRNQSYFADRYPAPASEKGVYPILDNIEWTSGFWSGINWLAYQFSGDQDFRDPALRHVASFTRRIDQRIATDTHDLGFLYSPSCVAAVKATGDKTAQTTALKAAELLLQRYLPVAGIIQAWGDLNDPAQAGRMIIDCNLNLPLLYWASQVSGKARFANAADSHLAQAMKYLVRPDASTFHTFFMDPVSGAPRYGKTHQGYSDTSCWSRGQAWGILGFALNFRYHPDERMIATAARLANYFLNRLPDDLICAWDLVFADANTQRDSSAAATAACGLIELAGHLPETDPDRPVYAAAAIAIVQSLASRYTDTINVPGGGLIAHGVYHMPNKIGIDECCIWGDYFYLEALMRLAKIGELFW